MEARLEEVLPQGPGWQYEPKWDGFRAIAVKRGGDVALTSRSGKPLGRYFPDIIAALSAVEDCEFAVDGELVIPVGDHLPSARFRRVFIPPRARWRG